MKKYERINQDPKLLAEIDEWVDVCFTVSMSDWPKDLGGFIPKGIAPRFSVLAEAYHNHEITCAEGTLIIAALFDQIGDTHG